MITVSLSEIMALKRSGVRGRTETEFGLSFFFARTPLIMVFLFASWGGGWNTELAVDFLSVRDGKTKVLGYARANASTGA